MKLNTIEKQIFSILLEAGKNVPGLTIRAAGGWVRDKLMEIESQDIDITVDIISGTKFAEIVLSYMREQGMDVKCVSTIEANVEANKNLESAILPILGVEVDFAQLRKETYNEDSRNPEIEVGVTPQEDARRRDLTINSLFYNLHTEEVEDYTGGISDIENRIARTPIDPLRTYLEDPLRILRAIRFIAKYELTPATDLYKAATTPTVISALKKKISRERVWTELSKTMVGKNLALAMEQMDKFGIRDLFLIPDETVSQEFGKWKEGFGSWDMDQNNPYHTYSVWEHTRAAMDWLENNSSINLIRTMSLLLHDVGKCDVCSQQTSEKNYTTYHEHEVSSALAADQILKDLKAPNEIRERVVKLVRNHMRLHFLESNGKSGLRRVLRDVGDDWENLVEISKADSMGKTSVVLDPKYSEMDEYIKEFKAGLGGLNEVKPPLNGNEIMTLLGLKPGPEVGKAMKFLKEALLESPEMTKEEATTLLMERK